MEQFFVLINTHFEYIFATMVATLIAFFAALYLSRLHFQKNLVNHLLDRILVGCFISAFLILFCFTFLAAITDPDFSVVQRYRHAVRAIKSWVAVKADPLLDHGGLEKALTLDTQWVSNPERVFYTIGRELHSILTNGKDHQELLVADDIIKRISFSPNGKKLSLKTDKKIIIYSLSDHSSEIIFDASSDAIRSGGQRIDIGGIQWSPDSSKICFFVNQLSSVASQSQWFVYDLFLNKQMKVVMKAYRDMFLEWATDSQRLYFNQRLAYKFKAHHILWFEIPLDTLTPQLKADLESREMDTSDEVLLENGIDIYHEDKRLRFENSQLSVRSGQCISSSGRRLWVNHYQQLCYQSVYGVRFCLFGLSNLQDYMNFPPKGKEAELTIQEMRWLPSDKYVLIRHYTFGLLVLCPIKQKIGALVNNKDVGLFGVYPE